MVRVKILVLRDEVEYVVVVIALERLLPLLWNGQGSYRYDERHSGERLTHAWRSTKHNTCRLTSRPIAHYVVPLKLSYQGLKNR
jgi:hypothetical protein